jgi:putative ABC transport system ATP-binding protein
LLLADEPTGSLDSVNALLVADLLFKLHHETNTAIVLVTHDETLAARCRRQIRVKDGHIVEGAGTALVAPSIVGAAGS